MSQSRPLQKHNVVIFIGKEFYHEGVESSLTSRGLKGEYLNLLRVSPKTWQSRVRRIQQLKEGGNLLGAVLYLPTPVILQAVKPGYDDAWRTILAELDGVPTIAFLYTDNLAGEFRPRNSETKCPESLGSLEAQRDKADEDAFLSYRIDHAIRQITEVERYKAELGSFLQLLFASSVQTSPFWARSDVTVRLEEFLEEVDQGIFLRLYVADDRFQSDQIASFLRVFERYLRQVESQDFRVETRKTNKGTLYVFCGTHGGHGFQSMEDALARFDMFMKLCRDDPSEASKLVARPSIEPGSISFIVGKYARDYQRLVIDAKHEFDQKALLMSQKMELDLLEFAADSTPILTSSGPSLILDISGNQGPVNLHLGDVSSISHQDRLTPSPSPSSLAETELALRRAFEAFASRLEAVQLKSNLDQLKDESSSRSEKTSAGQRISGFLYKVAGKIGSEAVSQSTKMMLDYVASLVGPQ